MVKDPSLLDQTPTHFPIRLVKKGRLKKRRLKIWLNRLQHKVVVMKKFKFKLYNLVTNKKRIVIVTYLAVILVQERQVNMMLVLMLILQPITLKFQTNFTLLKQ